MAGQGVRGDGVERKLGEGRDGTAPGGLVESTESLQPRKRLARRLGRLGHRLPKKGAMDSLFLHGGFNQWPICKGHAGLGLK